MPAHTRAGRVRRRRTPCVSPGKPDAQQHPDRAEPVAPGNVLALGERASVVRDRQLVDPEPALADLRRDLRLDPEPVLTQVERPQDVGAERLVPRLHVGQRRVVEQGRQQREEAVADEVPEEVRPLRLAAAETRTYARRARTSATIATTRPASTPISAPTRIELRRERAVVLTAFAFPPITCAYSMFCASASCCLAIARLFEIVACRWAALSAW